LSKLVYDDHKHKRARCELAAGDKKTFFTHSNEHSKEISRNADSSYFIT
jgi:hypothetical protein